MKGRATVPEVIEANEADTTITSGGASERRGLAPDGYVLVIAALAAVAAALADSSPTGTTVWDHALRAVVAGLFVIAVTRSPNWVCIICAAVAPAFMGSSIWLIPLSVGLVMALTNGLMTPRPWLRAGAAALAIQGLFRLPAIGFFGLPSIIAGFVITGALWFGYRNSSPAVRRHVRRGTMLGVVVTMIICAVGGVMLLSARSDVELGIEAARSGLSAARDGDPEAVVAELESAADALSAAQERTDSLFTQPLRLIPVVSQHRQAITTATRLGSAIARQASKATIEADISSITLSSGSLDLSALSAMEADLAKTAALLESGVRELGAARSPWLVSPVATRMQDLIEEMWSVLPEARVAADAARVVPGLMGQDAPRRYFVAFGSPAESRSLGGFIGSWALLEVDKGTIRQVEGGRVNELYDLSRSQEPLSQEQFPIAYVVADRPQQWPQNLAGSPQLSVVAEASRHLFDGLGGGPIDGFIYLDGYAIGAMLAITGPVTVDEISQTINASNADGFFFDEQYRLTDRDDLKAELNDIFANAFDGLLTTELPGPEQLGRILGPVARQGRIQIATFDEDENAFLRSIKLQRTFGAPATNTDGMALVQANGSSSKLDLYLHRQISYDVAVDGTGRLTGTVRAVFTSDVPDDAPEYALGTNEPGLNAVYLSLYTPHDVQSIRIDGEEVEFWMVPEFGYQRYASSFLLPANAPKVVEYELTGQVDPDRPYSLDIWHQPLVNNDMMDVRYTNPDGQTAERTLELGENAVISFPE